MAKEKNKWEKLMVVLELDMFYSLPKASEMKKLLNKINSKDLKVKALLSENCLLIEKKNITCEEAGEIINLWIIKNFDIKESLEEIMDLEDG